MSSQTTYITAAASAAGVLAGGYCAYAIYKTMKKNKLPTEWKEVGTLKHMYVYPIKSCGPVVLQRAECTVLGLRDGWLRDRVMMVVDDKNNFITARAHSELLKVHPEVRHSVMTLSHPDAEMIHVNLAEVVALNALKTATVWRISVPVFYCGFGTTKWFSSLLGRSTDFHLVYYASHQSRGLRGNEYKRYNLKKKDTGALPDEVPFNLVNEASVEDLNTRLKNVQVTHRNFRPNFVLSGGEAYDEDNWKFVKIGENIFEIIKPCTRCILTTIDPETGVRNPEREPLETLKSYRQIVNLEERKASGNSPRMGIQMALRSGPGGIVSINDPIYVAY